MPVAVNAGQAPEGCWFNKLKTSVLLLALPVASPLATGGEKKYWFTVEGVVKDRKFLFSLAFF